MPISEDEAEEQKFDESGMQVLDKTNNNSKINVGDILTVWNDKDNEKVNILLIKSAHMLTNPITTYRAYEAIAINTTKYTKAGSNEIGVYMSDNKIHTIPFACSHKEAVINTLKLHFDHVVKYPYVTIPIQHN